MDFNAFKLNRRLGLARPGLNCSSIPKSSAGHHFVSYFWYDIAFSPFPLFKLWFWDTQSHHCSKRLKSKGPIAALALALSHKTFVTQIYGNVP